MTKKSIWSRQKKDGETSFRFGLSSGKLSFEEAEDSEKSHHFQIDLLASSEDFENVKTSWMEEHPDYVIRELAQFTFRNKEMYGYLVLYHAKEENSSTEKETEEPETERITEAAVPQRIFVGAAVLFSLPARRL